MKKPEIMLTVGLAFLLGIFGFFSSASAAYHNYTCEDFTEISGATCDAGTLVFSGDAQYASDESGAFNFFGADTIYVYMTVDGSGSYRVLCGPTGDPTCNVGGQNVFTDTLFAEPIDATDRNGSTQTLYLRSDPAGGPFIGSISNICVATDLGECADEPPTPPATTTTATSTAAQTFGMGAGVIVLWAFVFIFVVWLIGRFTL